MSGSMQMDPGFDRYAEDYDLALNQGIGVSGEGKDYFARRRVERLAKRLAHLGQRPMSIIDFGCGTGSASPFLSSSFPGSQLVGTDISAKSIATARRLHGSADCSFEVFPDYQPVAQFDLAFCNGVFHHIPIERREEAFRYVYMALKPGGYFSFWENNPWNLGTRLVMSRIPFDRDAITLSPIESGRLLKKGGFAIEVKEALFIFPHFLRLFRGMESWLCRLPLGAQYHVLARKPEAD